jgi:serine/threonine-protein kinase RsbW
MLPCRCEPGEVSIAVKDEGKGFDIDSVPDPIAPQNIGSIHGRGIHVMKALMDEVRFEEGGVVVHMRKNAGEAPKLLAQNPQENETNLVRVI